MEKNACRLRRRRRRRGKAGILAQHSNGTRMYMSRNDYADANLFKTITELFNTLLIWDGSCPAHTALW